MSTKSTTSTKKKITTKTANQTTNKKISGKTKDDKMLERVEKYVDKNREKTSKEIMERKTSRPVRQYQEGDLEVMISKISIQTQSKKKTTENSKGILYTIYIIIIIVILILALKYLFAGKMPQIS